jgi:hypothetical protein
MHCICESGDVEISVRVARIRKSLIGRSQAGIIWAVVEVVPNISAVDGIVKGAQARVANGCRAMLWQGQESELMLAWKLARQVRRVHQTQKENIVRTGQFLGTFLDPTSHPRPSNSRLMIVLTAHTSFGVPSALLVTFCCSIVALTG